MLRHSWSPVVLLSCLTLAFPVAAGAQIEGIMVYADVWAGAVAGVKIQNAIAALPSTGGVVDAHGFTGTQPVSVDFLSGVSSTKPVHLLLGNAVFQLATTLSLTQGLRISGASTSSTSAGTVLQANSTFALDAPLMKNNASGVQEAVFLENLTFDGNNRADGVWFNGIRNSQINDGYFLNFSRSGDYALTVTDIAGVADAGNNNFRAFRTGGCYGGIHLVGNSTTNPPDDTWFFGMNLVATMFGVKIENRAATCAVQRTRMYGVVINTASSQGLANAGMATATNGSTAVTGSGTSFASSMVGLTFNIGGQGISIASVTDATHLTLVANWPYSTQTNQSYSIEGPRGVEDFGCYGTFSGITTENTTASGTGLYSASSLEAIAKPSVAH